MKWGIRGSGRLCGPILYRDHACFPARPLVASRSMNATEKEKKLVEEIRKKLERGEKLTPREERIYAYSPFGTAAKR